MNRRIGLCLICLLPILLVVGCRPIHSPPPTEDSAQHFIWVGDDSLSTGPLDFQTQLLMETSSYPYAVQMDSFVAPRNLLSYPAPADDFLSAYSQYKNTFVILQIFGIEKPTEEAAFFSNAETWLNNLKKDDLTPLLLYPWFSQVDSKGTREQMDRMVHQLAWETGLTLVPVAPTWEKVIQEQPQIQLYASDGLHPSPEGLYLTACVLYTSLTGISPVGNTSFSSKGFDQPDQIVLIDKKIANILQQAAWDVIQDYQQKGEFRVTLLQ